MTNTKAPPLSARDVHLWRGERHLLNNVSFELRSGELLQLVGPNGVGKTSLLRVCSGVMPMESGALLYDNEPIERIRDRYHANLTYLAHNNALKGDLTATENLRFELRLRRQVSADAIVRQLGAVGIEHCAALPARVLSAGQRRRLALARVALSGASLWILDEPTTNLDTSGITLVEQLMLSHLQNGGSILAAAHHRLLSTFAASKILELQA
jgi:heme exporter protein A